jgi:sarcosine oxidase subunit alpha
VTRLPPDAPHQFGGIEIDRGRPLSFRLNGRRVDGFVGDTVLSAVLASGIDTYGEFGNAPLGLTDQFAPLVCTRSGQALPMNRLAAADGFDLTTVGHRGRWTRGAGLVGRLDGVPELPWLRDRPGSDVAADLLIVGGGVAGLAAAEAAALAGRTVVLAERRPWLGGDARYFGRVGDEESPEAVIAGLLERLAGLSTVTTFTGAEAFALQDGTARLHIVEGGDSRIIAVVAKRVLLATGTFERLPIFAGNRLPGVSTSIAAYHLAKRYGVVRGSSAVVSTQSNFGYRLALRLHDAGVAVRRVVDARIRAQSRFVDFAKASGLTLGSGQVPLAATLRKHHTLQLAFSNVGTATTAFEVEANRLLVSGPLQPDLALWMLAGGGSQWVDGRLIARGRLDHTMLAGSVLGYRSMRACIESGRAAQAELFGAEPQPVADVEIGAPFETPEAATSVAPPADGAPAFFDTGPSLIARLRPSEKPILTTYAQAPSLGDVAASVDLGLTSPADAGAVAEERGAPGADLVATEWVPPAEPVEQLPPWLAARFKQAPTRLHLVVDGKRRFDRGALVYDNTSAANPMLAIGVVVETGSGPEAGGFALIEPPALAKTDRFIVETLDGPAPARVAR